MDKYTREIMELLKSKFEEVVGKKKFQGGSETCSYYLFALADNLYKPMGEKALISYGNGSGNEIFSGKMNALRSSSALTYNLFGNDPAKITKQTENARIGNGVYDVEFEKQYHTLKTSVSNRPANLDAFLYCEETQEAVACEMKMMEWICNKPGELKKAYLDEKSYINEEAGKAFVQVANELIENGANIAELEKFPCKMTRYDAFQMFKHAVACYTACAGEEAREIKKLTLVNCVWTLPMPKKHSSVDSDRYISEESCEHTEFDEFVRLMQPVKSLFAGLKVDFDIQFYAFKDFLSLLDKTESELNYLKRYTFD